MNPKQHILDTLEALILSLDTDTSTTGTDILNKTINFSKSLHAIVPDPVDLEQEETYLLHDNNLLRQSGIPTLALIHHFFEYKTPLTLELSHAQLQEAWVRYAIKIKNFIKNIVKPSINDVLNNGEIPATFNISKMCLIWDYVIHHHRVAIITERLGLLDQMDWASLTDRYVFIMQVITVGEAFKDMPNSLKLHIMKVLTKILNLSEFDAGKRIELMKTLRNQFTHLETPEFHNQWCDLFHGNTLSDLNEQNYLKSFEVLQAIYNNQHLLINHELEVHYQDALLDSLEQSENNVSTIRTQRQSRWLMQLIDFEQGPNNKTGKKVNTLETREPLAFNETTVTGYQSLDETLDPLPIMEPTTLRRRKTSVHADTLKPIIVFTPTPQLSYSYTTTTLNDTHLLQNRVDLYKDLYNFHTITRRKRIEAFKKLTPSSDSESGLMKLIEVEKLLVILAGSLLRPLIHEVTETENLNKAKQTIKIRNGLAHKASLFKDDGNNIDMLGGVSLPNIS
ncbi:MAG: hypothetical protein VX835_01065 [Pseudomonadota bacterium]|nr:hypothetical protein [Pseudomonadota bacterium]